MATYSSRMTNAAAELERVNEKYAPARRLHVAIYMLGFVALGVASLFREVDWFAWAAAVAGAGGWELTKFRLRRNARDFAAASN